MRIFGRQPAPAQVPRPPGAAAQVAQVRAVDEEHYADAGFARVAGSAVYRRALLPGAWLVVLDDLTSRDPVRRAYVGVGVHDEALQRALARLVPGGRYTAAVASVQSALPLAEDTSPDRLAQRSVLLYGPGDGRLREQERVRSVVALPGGG